MAFNIDSDEKYEKAKSLVKNKEFALARPDEARELFSAVKAYSEKKDTDRWNASLDLTPHPYKPREPSIRALGAGMVKEDETAKLAASGVDVDTGLSVLERLTIGMVGHDKEAGFAALDYVASKRLEAAGVRLPPGHTAAWTAPNSDKVGYWRPYKDEEGNLRIKPTLANEVGLSAGDVAAAMPGTISVAAELGAEVGATIAGTVASGGNVPIGIVTGSAFAGGANFLAHKTRKYIGEQLGLPKEVTDELKTSEDLERAAWATGFSIGVPSIVGLGKAAGNLRRPIAANDKVSIDRAKEYVAKTIPKIRELERTTGQEFRISAAAITGSPTLLVQEKSMLNRVTGKRSAQANIDVLSNHRSAVGAVDAIADAVVPPNPHFLGPSEVAQKAQAVVREPIEKMAQQKAEAEVTQEVLRRELPDVFEGSVYQGLQKDLAARHTEAATVNTRNWNEFRANIGFNTVTRTSEVQVANPKNTLLRKTLTRLDREGLNALSASSAKATNSLLDDLGVPAVEKGARGNMIGEGLGGEVLDMHHLHKLSSQLKAEMRSISTRDGMGWKKADLQELIGAIDYTIRKGRLVHTSSGKALTGAEAGGVRTSFSQAVESTKRYHEVWDDGALKSVFETQGGEFTIRPGTLRKTLFKADDAGTLKRILDISKDDINVKAAIGKEFETYYKSKVMVDGKFSDAAHSNFLNQHADHLQDIFGQAGSDYIKRTGNIGNAIKAMDLQAKQVRHTLQHAYGKRLTDEQMYAGNVARDALRGELSTKQIANLRTALASSNAGADTWQNIQRSGLDALQQEFLKKSGNQANSDAMSKLLVDHSERLTELYGPTYVQNLTTLRDVIGMMERNTMGGAVRRDPQPIWLAVSRNFLGAMDPMQRKLTAANKLARRLSDDRLSDLLNNPDLLHGLIKHDAMTRQVAQGLEAVGVGLAEYFNNEETVPE